MSAATTAPAGITARDITATYPVIRPHLRRTPVLDLPLAELTGPDIRTDSDQTVALKLEYLQCAGAFKARGAFANLLLRRVPEPGVVAASGGNHGVAVAYAAHRLGVPATVFVPSISAPAKVDRIRELGARLVVGGERYADALAASVEWQERTGSLPVHAFDQRETILGQGTLALELAEQRPELDTVLVPVGGGGLLAGIAAYFAGRVRVVGVEPAESPTLRRALAAGRPVDAPAGGIAADALAPRRVGELVYPLAEAYVSEVVLVDDQAIRDARRALWQAARVLVEPAAAVGVAALRTGGYRPARGERLAVVLSGANTGDLPT